MMLSEIVPNEIFVFPFSKKKQKKWNNKLLVYFGKGLPGNALTQPFCNTDLLHCSGVLG